MRDLAVLFLHILATVALLNAVAREARAVDNTAYQDYRSFKQGESRYVAHDQTCLDFGLNAAAAVLLR
jgi:hypothetical protein